MISEGISVPQNLPINGEVSYPPFLYKRNFIVETIFRFFSIVFFFFSQDKIRRSPDLQIIRIASHVPLQAEFFHVDHHPLLVRRFNYPHAFPPAWIMVRIIGRLDDTDRFNEMTAANFARVDEHVRRDESLVIDRRVGMKN